MNFARTKNRKARDIWTDDHWTFFLRFEMFRGAILISRSHSPLDFRFFICSCIVHFVQIRNTIECKNKIDNNAINFMFLYVLSLSFPVRRRFSAAKVTAPATISEQIEWMKQTLHFSYHLNCLYNSWRVFVQRFSVILLFFFFVLYQSKSEKTVDEKKKNQTQSIVKLKKWEWK